MDKRKLKQINKLEDRLSGKSRKSVYMIESMITRFVYGLVSYLISVGLFIALLPVNAVISAFLYIRQLLTGKSVYIEKEVFGVYGKPLKVKYYNLENDKLNKFSLIFYVLTGDIDLVGVSIREYSKEERELGEAYLLDNSPGLISLWYIRQASRTAYEGRFSTEWEFTYKRNPIYDLLLLLKGLPALLYSGKNSDFNSKVNLIGIEFDNKTMDQAVEDIDKAIETENAITIYYVNPDCFNRMYNDRDYYNIIKSNKIVYPDGIGVHIACKMLGNPLKENINGTDMFPYIRDLAIKKEYRIYLLGGKPGVAEQMKDKLKEDYPEIKICGTADGYFDRSQSNEVVERINESKADILFVAFGAPLQEKWINEHRNIIKADVVLGVGGLFDFYSERIERAPRWMREIGMEWSYRLYKEPVRMWRRYIIGNPLFLFRVLDWKYRMRGRNGSR